MMPRHGAPCVPMIAGGGQEGGQAVPRGEFLTYQELEKRTNVHVEWIEAPGQ